MKCETEIAEIILAARKLRFVMRELRIGIAQTQYQPAEPVCRLDLRLTLEVGCVGTVGSRSSTISARIQPLNSGLVSKD